MLLFAPKAVQSYTRTPPPLNVLEPDDWTRIAAVAFAASAISNELRITHTASQSADPDTVVTSVMKMHATVPVVTTTHRSIVTFIATPVVGDDRLNVPLPLLTA